MGAMGDNASQKSHLLRRYAQLCAGFVRWSGGPLRRRSRGGVEGRDVPGSGQGARGGHGRA